MSRIALQQAENYTASILSLQRLQDWLKSFARLIIRFRLWIFGLIVFVVFVLEFLEMRENLFQIERIDLGEVVVYLSLLITISVLIEFLLRAMISRTHANTILDLKHKLSQSLTPVLGWQELVDRIKEFAGTLVSDTVVDLILPGMDSPNIEIFTSGNSTEALNRRVELAATESYCQACSGQNGNRLHPMRTCAACQVFQPQETLRGYCLPVIFENSKTALLQFYPPAGRSFSDDQVDIMNNIGTEISAALNLVQQRIALSEYLIANAADSTRREISRDLHDTLGQNLSYLHLKLGQFTRLEAHKKIAEIQPEMQRMLVAAGESLDLLRNNFVGLGTGSQSRLSNFLKEYGGLIAERASFEMHFKRTGSPYPLVPAVLRQIMYVCREALNNIERHASAKQVQIEVNWSPTELMILIQDDGVGFDLGSVQADRHYGLKIMQERMHALSGSICVESELERGTRLTIILPLEH
jgi:signal transduction histidine kinase